MKTTLKQRLEPVGGLAATFGFLFAAAFAVGVCVILCASRGTIGTYAVVAAVVAVVIAGLAALMARDEFNGWRKANRKLHPPVRERLRYGY